MVDLFLDNQKAVIKDNTTFKFNIDNQAFSQQGSYSFEIALPLMGCAANLNIFGSINRCEANLNKISGTFRLITDVLTYEGKYKITSVTEEDVKVQLMSDKTLMNAESKDDRGNKLYIDELDLGYFWDEWDWYKVAHAAPESEIVYPPTQVRDYSFFIEETYHKYIHEGPEISTCVCFPIISKTVDGGSEINQANIHCNHEKYGYCLDFPYDYHHPKFFYRDLIAMQPTLKEVLRRILKSMGLILRNKIDILNYTYIANSRCKVYYKDILPHWTISEFLKEVANFFDAVFITYGDEVHFISRQDLFSGKIQTIEDIVDEYTMQNDEDSEDDYSATGNIDYEWPDDDSMLRLPDEIFEKAVIKNFDNFNALQSFYVNLTKIEKEQSRFLFVDKSTNRKYASLQNDKTQEFELSRVDYYPSLIRDNNTRDINTSLRIVPVRMSKERVGQFLFDVPSMVVDDVIIAENVYSVNDNIRPSADSSSNNTTVDKRDVIEVFYYTGSIRVGGGTTPIPLGVMVTTNVETGLLEKIPFEKQGDPINSIGPYTLEERFNAINSSVVDTHREYQFKFIKKGPIDINRPFLIRGKKYVCKQLQYDCSSTEVLPLIQGYFFAID